MAALDTDLPSLPPRAAFLETLGGADPDAAALLRILLAKLDPDAPLAAQLTAAEHLGRFVVAGPRIRGVSGNAALARLELLVVALERIPAARKRFEATLFAMLSQTYGIKLFGEIGLPNERGLWAETTDRLARRFLPEAPRPHELWMLAGHIIRSLDDLSWLGPSADPLLHRLAAAGGAAWTPLRHSILDAITLITARIAAIGTSEAFRSRAGVAGVRESPLFQLTRVEPTEMPPLIEAARVHLDNIRQALEDTGVSIDVVYALDSIERGLSRIELLLPFAGGTHDSTYEIRAVIAAVGRGLVANRSFKQLMADNLRLLARKVIERAGRTGEHYVTSSRREYWAMLKSAAGGGPVVVVLTAGKFLIKWGHFAPFLDAILASAAYSGAFIVMQLLGLTLATKQPSMTAAALAGSIRDRSGPGQLDELVMLIARIARSQFAALVGNVGAVVVVGLLFDFLYTRATGSPFLDRESAIHTAQELDPVRSGTVFFAALTGVLLWISSLFAGWFENWIVYRKLPDAIEHHRWGKRLGKKRMARAARFLERNAAGFGGSVSLGLLFGFVPQMGAFFGIPLAGRHVTITTTSLALAVSSAGIDGLGAGTLAWACVGIAVIGLLNFGVSFALALIVALRARDVPRGQRRTLPAAVMRRFFKKPLEFFVPPREPAGSTPPPAHHH